MSLSAIGIAKSGLLAAAKRLEASASNVANMDSTGPTPNAAGNTTAYRPVTVRQSETESGGTTATTVERQPAFEPRLDPDSPDADERGMVAAPAVNMATEITDQIGARIAYEANAAVMKTANRMADRLLDTFI